MNVQNNVILSVSVQDNGRFTGSSDRPPFSGETIIFKKADFARNNFGIYN